jgi:hypothetical protein
MNSSKFQLSVLFCLAFTQQVQASDVADQRPPAIDCKIVQPPKELEAVASFKIEKLNTKSPNSNIVDTSLLDPIDDQKTKVSGVVNVSFSNQCDNMFEITLLQQNLVDLKDKKLKLISGVIGAYTADSKDLEAKHSISCKVLQ